MFFDVDETLKHPKNEHQPNRFHPNLPLLLFNLRQLGKVGIATDQSQLELQGFINKLSNYLGQPVTTGPYILEGGHILANSLYDQAGEIITSPQALTEIVQIYELIRINYSFNNGDEWGTLPGVITPIQLPDESTQALGSKSIYEKGPSIEDPTYAGEYEAVMDWLTKEAELAGLLIHTALMEAGNGTLRIIEKGVDKSAGLLLLQHRRLIDLSRVIYTGNGVNDVAPAKVVKEYGGVVIAVSNAHQELKKLADIITTQPISDGVIEVFSQIVK